MKVRPLLPQPILQTKFLKGTSIVLQPRKDPLDVGDMFIRFVSGEIDEDSQVSAGLFCAASKLKLTLGEGLPEYERDVLSATIDWFDLHLESPFDYLPRTFRNERAVSWFKPTAREHLARAWELVMILERNDVLIWTIKSKRTGYVYYEDEAQIFAQPSADVRLRL